MPQKQNRTSDTRYTLHNSSHMRHGLLIAVPFSGRAIPQFDHERAPHAVGDCGHVMNRVLPKEDTVTAGESVRHRAVRASRDKVTALTGLGQKHGER